MAEGKFYLRPSADISVEHTLVPAESTAAYLLLNEEVSDGSTTCIRTAGVAGETVTQTSSFKMSGTMPSEARCILDAKVGVTYVSSLGSWNVSAIIGEKSFVLSKDSIGGNEYSSEDFINEIKSYNVLPEINVTLTSSITVESGVKIISNTSVTQLYVEVKYSNGINRKVNGEWKPSLGVYQKINGTWQEIDNGYETVGSRLFSSGGHHQEYLPAREQTCTEDGITEGYKCSICGEVFIPQEVIPATGHSYIASGGKQVCSTCQYVDGMGYVELVYHGTAAELSSPKEEFAATTIGNYALFGGGLQGSYNKDTVDAYDTSLTKSTATALSVPRDSLAATTVGNYALFGGGYDSGSRSVDGSHVSGTKAYLGTVDAYNSSLTKTTPTELSAGRSNLAATTVGNYALFGGGYDPDNKNSSVDYLSTVDAYDISLTRTIPSELTQAKQNLAATTIGNYALFGGGLNSSSVVYDTVDVYDTSLTKITITEPLSVPRYSLAATTVGNYALFAGGSDGENNYCSTVDAYDTSLTKSTVGALSEARACLDATSICNYALFGGGWTALRSSKVDTYDISLTKSTASDLSAARGYLAAATIGNYVLFGGGWAGTSNYYSTVDAYKIQPIS